MLGHSQNTMVLSQDVAKGTSELTFFVSGLEGHLSLTKFTGTPGMALQHDQCAHFTQCSSSKYIHCNTLYSTGNPFSQDVSILCVISCHSHGAVLCVSSNEMPRFNCSTEEKDTLNCIQNNVALYRLTQTLYLFSHVCGWVDYCLVMLIIYGRYTRNI